MIWTQFFFKRPTKIYFLLNKNALYQYKRLHIYIVKFGIGPFPKIYIELAFPYIFQLFLKYPKQEIKNISF
jgi:hypothetical protein